MNKGMEIFNEEDYSEDFLELDDSSLIGDKEEIESAVISKPKESAPQNQKKVKKEEDEESDEESEKDDADELDVLLPSNEQNAENIDDQESSTLSPKFFSSLVQALKEGGILEDVEEDKVQSPDDFLKVIEESIKQREYADLTDQQKEYLESLRDGVSHEEVSSYQRNIDAYSSITEEALAEESDEGEDLRRTILANNFMQKGFSEAKAKKLIDKIFDSGEDVDEAKDALSELIQTEKKAFEEKKQQAAAQKKAQEKAEKEAINKLNKIVKETTEIIPGLQIPQNLKNNIIKGLTQPVGFTEDHKPLDIISKYLYENPIEGRVKIAYLLSVTDGFNKMDVLENKKAKKQAWKDLAESIKFKEEGGGRTEENGFQFDFESFKF